MSYLISLNPTLFTKHMLGLLSILESEESDKFEKVAAAAAGLY